MSSDPKRVIYVEDRFRELPDEILCDILSLIPTKEAARTSVLSKRWRYLFLLVPKLIVEGESELWNPNPEVVREMIRFVKRWIMSSEEVPVNEMRLTSDYFPESSVFSFWLTTLLLRRIKVLEIVSTGQYLSRSLMPPEEFFRSETLVELRITGGAFVFEVPDFICYPSLKILHLEYISVDNDSAHYRFVDDAYPLLEYLCLRSITFGKHGDVEKAVLTISLPTLKKLVVYYDMFHRLVIDRVDIVTPHLHHFQFMVEEDGEEVMKYDMQVNFSKCESLVYADVYQFGPGESYIKLLSQINNVKTLRLSEQFPEDYNDFAGSFPQFLHLTHLKLRETVYQSVWTLLHHAPNLQVLDYIMFTKDEDFLPPQDVPQCLSHRLGEIRISNYKWHEDEMDDDDIEADEMDDDDIEADEIDDIIDTATKTIQYFLQHGAVLKRMRIGHSKMKTAEWRHSTLNLLQSLVRLSPDCEIDLQEEGN